MAISRIQQFGFTAGELDPKLKARNDLEAYYSGAAKIRNALVIPQGSVKRRPGLKYHDILKQGNIKLFPFKYSDEEQYVFILTDLAMDIYKDGVHVVTIPVTITEAQINNVTHAQSNLALLLFSHEFRPLAFVLDPLTSTWTSAPWPLQNIPTYNFAVSPTVKDLKITSDLTGTAAIDFSTWVVGDVFLSAYARFDDGTDIPASYVNRYIRGPLGGYAKVKSIASTGTGVEVAEIDIIAPFQNDKNTRPIVMPAGQWQLEEEAWSDIHGWPACGTFHQGRLWVANTIDQPNTIWGSKVFNETNFENWTPEFDDNGIMRTAGGGVASTFHRLHSGQHLTIHSDTGEYYVPVSKSSPITPTNISIVRNSSYGSLNLPIFEIDGSLLFVREGGKSLIESVYTFASGKYTNADLNLLSAHILNNPVSVAYRKQTSTNESDYYLSVNEDGTLSVLCTLKDQKVTAWAKCETEGSFVGTVVEKDIMYFAVDRTIDGSPVRYLESFDYDLLTDSGVHQTSTIDFTEVSGLDHLIGEEVDIILDNTIQPSQVVGPTGIITLLRPGKEAHVGLPFPIVDIDTGSQVYIETMPIEARRQDTGTSVGKKKRISEATLLVYETSHAIVNRNKFPVRLIGITLLNTPVPKVTGQLTLSGISGWDDIIVMSVGQTLSLPLELLSLTYKLRY